MTVDNDPRLAIEPCPHGGYLVTTYMGSKPLCAATEIDDALGFIKDKLECRGQNDLQHGTKHGDNMPL